MPYNYVADSPLIDHVSVLRLPQPSSMIDLADSNASLPQR